MPAFARRYSALGIVRPPPLRWSNTRTITGRPRRSPSSHFASNVPRGCNGPVNPAGRFRGICRPYAPRRRQKAPGRGTALAPSPSVRPILIVPGYGDSGPGHWQTLLEANLPGARRVRMPSFTEPEPEGWIAALDAAIASAAAPPVLVAHSLGCIAIAHWAAAHRRRVHGALLVAPADVEKCTPLAPLRAFAPIPTAPLDFRSIVVASTDDPYLELVRAHSIAASWGATLAIVEDGGHLNVESGHGPWLDGEILLGELL
jgi:uncharacterized protein